MKKFLVYTFTQTVKAEKPTKEQVAGALATSFAIGRGKNVPVKAAIDEEIDRAELFYPSLTCLGLIDAMDAQGAIKSVIELIYKNSVHEDIRFFAQEVAEVYSALPTIKMV